MENQRSYMVTEKSESNWTFCEHLYNKIKLTVYQNIIPQISPPPKLKTWIDHCVPRLILFRIRNMLIQFYLYCEPKV